MLKRSGPPTSSSSKPSPSRPSGTRAALIRTDYCPPSGSWTNTLTITTAPDPIARWVSRRRAAPVQRSRGATSCAADAWAACSTSTSAATRPTAPDNRSTSGWPDQPTDFVHPTGSGRSARHSQSRRGLAGRCRASRGTVPVWGASRFASHSGCQRIPHIHRVGPASRLIRLVPSNLRFPSSCVATDRCCGRCCK